MVEIGCFQHNIGGAFGNMRISTTDDAGKRNRFLTIRYHQVIRIKLISLAIQGRKLLTFFSVSDDDYRFSGSAFQLVIIKGVQRMPGFIQNIVGNIHDIIDGTQT